MKQFQVYATRNRKSFDGTHTYKEHTRICGASTLKTAKQIIKKYSTNGSGLFNFEVYDVYSDKPNDIVYRYF